MHLLYDRYNALNVPRINIWTYVFSLKAPNKSIQFSLLFVIVIHFYQQVFRLIYNWGFLFLPQCVSGSIAPRIDGVPATAHFSYLLPFSIFPSIHPPNHLQYSTFPFPFIFHPLLYLLLDIWALGNCGHDNRKTCASNQSGASLHSDLFIHASINKAEESKKTLCVPVVKTHVNPYFPVEDKHMSVLYVCTII